MHTHRWAVDTIQWFVRKEERCDNMPKLEEVYRFGHMNRKLKEHGKFVVGGNRRWCISRFTRGVGMNMRHSVYEQPKWIHVRHFTKGARCDWIDLTYFGKGWDHMDQIDIWAQFLLCLWQTHLIQLLLAYIHTLGWIDAYVCMCEGLAPHNLQAPQRHIHIHIHPIPFYSLDRSSPRCHGPWLLGLGFTVPHTKASMKIEVLYKPWVGPSYYDYTWTGSVL